MIVRAALMAAVAAGLAGAALLSGLTFTALRTGRIVPLDWLFPATVAIIGMSILMPRFTGARWSGAADVDLPAHRHPWIFMALAWALIFLPIALLLGEAGARVPVAGICILAALLAIVAGICALACRLGTGKRLIALLGCLIGAALLPRLVALPVEAVNANHEARERPSVGVLTALPLQGAALGAAYGLPTAESIGLRSPLWRVLEGWFALHPIDALEGDQLHRADVLLAAQPRLLSPAELVALDAWVRNGGRAVILADPLLHWPDPRPLAHPERAPLTSLLDPLLTHWGVRLESAELDMGEGGGHHGSHEPDRWVLESGAMLQLSGASRFTQLQNANCALVEEGFVARCVLGKGAAVLVADADWIDDALWTLEPASPENRNEWTSDAPAVLAAWLGGGEAEVAHLTAWLSEGSGLVRAVRASLMLLFILLVTFCVAVRRLYGSHENMPLNCVQNRNIDHTKGDHP